MADKKKKSKNKEADIKNPIDVLTSVLKVPTVSIPANYSEIERYQLNPPFSDAVIAKGKSAGDIIYIVDERPLQSNEIEGYNKLRELVERDLEPPSEDKPRKNYHAQLLDIAESNSKVLQGLPTLSVEKIIYYLERDILGFGKIDSLMADPSIEDISCAGVKKPIFIWHQNYDSLRTNLVFDTDQELEDFVMKQVHRAGKHTSAAFPVTDVTLPGKHRLAIYYKTEVTPFGTSFTIRKFREDPFTVIDLVETGTIDENIAAYFWLLMEHKFSTMIIGSTGAGKTTSLNAICCLIQPTNKICTVEEVSEINLPHENWVPLIARSGFGLENEGEISLFQLIKSALRHRPDFIVVGEVRGEESYVLFQALATGHGGLCTMHGDSANSAIKRLTQHPMNIALGNIPLMHSAAVIKKVRMRKSDKESGYFGSARRIVQIAEITSPETTKDIFTWNPTSDTFDHEIVSSHLLNTIAADNGLTRDEMIDEFEKRRVIIGWLTQNHIRDYRSVSKVVSDYYRDPDKTYEKAAKALGL